MYNVDNSNIQMFAEQKLFRFIPRILQLQYPVDG